MLRVLAGGRIVLGTILLAAPEVVLGPLVHRRVSAGERAVARLLGVRNLVEGALVGSGPSRNWLLADAAVDATHALSMVALAAIRPEHRRLATASGLVATATAAAGLAAARSRGR